MPRGPDPLLIESPVAGTVTDVADLEVPSRVVRRSINMTPRFGRLETRPGLLPSIQTGPGGRVIGGIAFKTSAGAGRVVAANRTTWKHKGGSGWADLTPGPALTATDDDHARFAVFPTGTPQVNLLIGVNHQDTPKKWNGAAATFSDLGGSPPAARDVVAVDNYVILLNVLEGGNRFTVRLRISQANQPEVWPANFTWDLPSGGDDIVAGRALGRTSFAVLKDESQWVGLLSPGILPYKFEKVDDQPGPVSTGAVVSHGRFIYWLASDARVYRFNGVSAEPVTDTVDREFQRLFRVAARARSFGFYNRRNRAIWFIFPSGTDNADAAISYYPDTGASYFHQFGLPLSAGWTGDDATTVTWDDLTPLTWDNISAIFPTWDSFGGTLIPVDYVGSVAGQVYRFHDGFNDDGIEIPMLWETPLRAPVSPKHMHRFDGLESSFRKKTAGPKVTVSIGISEALAEEHPEYKAVGVHETELGQRQLLTKDKVEGRFMSFKYEATTLAGVGVEYQGGLLHAWHEEVA